MTTADQLLSLDRFQPADRGEVVKRALYYCHSVHLCCRRQTRMLLAQASGGQLGEQMREAVAHGVSEWGFNSAVKILTVTSLHVIGLARCSQAAEPWLVDFLFETLKEADELFATPTAEEVIETHGAYRRDRMLFDVAEHTLEALGLPLDDPNGLAMLQRFLSDFESSGDELLVFALSQPDEAMGHHLRSLDQ